jgi:hypothetical protein
MRRTTRRLGSAWASCQLPRFESSKSLEVRKGPFEVCKYQREDIRADREIEGKYTHVPTRRDVTPQSRPAGHGGTHSGMSGPLKSRFARSASPSEELLSADITSGRVACEWFKTTGARDIEDVRQDSRKLGMLVTMDTGLLAWLWCCLPSRVLSS